MKQSLLEESKRNRREARENGNELITIVFALPLYYLESGANLLILRQSTWGIFFDGSMKISLLLPCLLLQNFSYRF